MFSLWDYLKKRFFAIKVRKWQRKDALAIYSIEQQGQGESDVRQLSLKMLFDQIENEGLYGAVATKNSSIKAFGGVYLGRTHEMVIYVLHADESEQNDECLIALIQHFFSVRGLWGKIFLSIKISEDDEAMRQFLMNKNGFVITEMNECFDDPSDPAHIVYTLHHPPPEGFDPKKITILVNGKEKSKRP